MQMKMKLKTFAFNFLKSVWATARRVVILRALVLNIFSSDLVLILFSPDLIKLFEKRTYDF
jgi:hypothetical protein